MVEVVTDGPSDWVVRVYGIIRARFSGHSAVFEACRFAMRYGL